jgi:KipI family sensor histidine kinase inhibitor
VSGVNWQAAGDAAVLFFWRGELDPAVNARVVRWAEAIRERGLPGVTNVVPSYMSLLVAWDPWRLTRAAVLEAAWALLPGEIPEPPPLSRVFSVPVKYGAEAGPDLTALALQWRRSPEEIVRLHAAETYRIYCLGFAPGFPMAGPLPPALEVPRRTVPRPRVPAGSVAIAGRQTGIYSLPTPGGWHLLGRTPVRVFTPGGESPTLWRPGDGVRFVPVDDAVYAALAARAPDLRVCLDTGDGPLWTHGLV